MQKQSHRHLREEDRKIIYRMMKAEKTQKEIAAVLGVSQGTISKELRRNRGLRGYRPGQAEKKALERQANKAVRRRVLRGELLAEVEERLRRKESPEQIRGALRALSGEGPSHETIYRHIVADKQAGGDLWRNLRINGKRRYRHRVKGPRRKIPDRKGIEARPAVVAARSRYGDWECDLIAGKQGSGYLLSLYERKSRLGRLVKLSSKQSQETADAVIAALTSYKVRTITYDNGLEFAEHGRISEALGAAGYFCEPYHSWEKGGVENFNGLVRQYLPKGCDLRRVDAEEVKKIQDEINRRPRKVLGFHRPIDHENKLAA
jgi:IS30 family transposase